MCDNVCIEVNETVENISIEVRDFSVLNIISEDANNSATIGSDGLLFVPESSNVTYADQTEVNDGTVSDKVIAPNTLAGWWTYVKGLAQTFAQKITFSSGALFSPQVTPTHERGRVYFDDVNDCISFMDSISGTSVQVGYEVLMRARNNTGVTIPNGSVVYISGAIGQNSTVALAQSNTLPTSEIIGIATHDISNNTVGKICVFGLVNDLNTSSFTDGQMLYLSATVAGGLTSTIPASPNFVVALGVVEHAHPTQGKILVRPQIALSNNNALGTAQNVPPTQNAVKTALDSKVDKVTTSGVERAYIINADGSQSTKSTSEFKDILEFANLVAFPATGESGKIYLALDANLQYRWSGSAYVQIGGGSERKYFETLGNRYTLTASGGFYSSMTENGFISDNISTNTGNILTNVMAIRWVTPLLITDKICKLKDFKFRASDNLGGFTQLRIVIFIGQSVNGQSFRINNQIIHDETITMPNSGQVAFVERSAFTNDVTIPSGYDLCYLISRVDGTGTNLYNVKISGYVE